MKVRQFFLFLFCPVLLFANPFEDNREIKVQNCILATVNGHTISVLDVMKKMDLFLKQNYSDYAKDINNRYQFFSANWKNTLSQMINNQLILADAEKLDIKILEGEIREELHKRFGPSVMAKLDELNMTYEEAWQSIYADMAIQRMSWYRIHSKAMQQIGPTDIKSAYKEYLVSHPPKERWRYQVLSIRAATEKLGTLVAQRAQTLLASASEQICFEDLAKKLQESQSQNSEVTIKLSKEYNLENKELSKAHWTALQSLKPKSYSAPISQVSRFDKSIVHRIFYLIDHVKDPSPTFDSMVEKLHEELVQNEVNKQFPEYIKKLRKRFNISEEKIFRNIPSNFQPFILK